MKFVTFRNQRGDERAGWIKDRYVVDMHALSRGGLPDNMLAFLQGDFIDEALRLDQILDTEGELSAYGEAMYDLDGVSLCAPIPKPPSVRDFYAFEEHVKTARSKRGLDVVPEWYEFPVFYFSNYQAIIGPGYEVERPRKCNQLDYELELACIIGKIGRNISVDEAEDYIFGYCIMNDWSARDIQLAEVKVGLGPAKGKDFATSLGPYLVTKDELECYRTDADRFDLVMTARVNGKLLSQGNFRTIYYSFADMIARASEDATLFPGDVIGSGTVGTGCILELGTEVHRWLEPDDVVELEITGLGVLRNKVRE
ncbi:fumarylacetoacetate hydrolase family protein [Paenibacillus sp. GCM10027628]|uniref:fumarylacetoacetate hydrolase family protein n=1 Tax=Paenibacillus sp. GCM10027628 TaxID=3273413 RepID=UPI003635EA06